MATIDDRVEQRTTLWEQLSLLENANAKIGLCEVLLYPKLRVVVSQDSKIRLELSLV